MTNKNNAIIVINAGSSSLKFKILKETNLQDIVFGQITGIGTAKTKFVIKSSADNSVLKEEILDSNLSRDDLLVYLLDTLANLLPEVVITSAGHRVVHGGKKYISPTIITDEVISYLHSIINLTPIHLPHNIRPMEVLKEKFPSIKQVACFDTAFHSTNPDFTRYYAIPRKLIEEDNIIRYGFHGLSYEYIASSLKDMDDSLYNGKVVICHLGAGASLCALVNGKSFTTTMGFTPLDGLPMGSRTGSIDAGILLYLMKNKNYSYEQLEDLLYYKSGVLGLSDKSSDFYVIETSEDDKSKEAWKVFSYNLIKTIGSLIVAMGGVDGIVFTAGVGENSDIIRNDVAVALKFLGVEIDSEANAKGASVISKPDSKVKMMVIPTNEELMIATHTLKLTK